MSLRGPEPLALTQLGEGVSEKLSNRLIWDPVDTGNNLRHAGRSTNMSITGLSRELISQILLLLDPSDRLSSALTCRDWAEIIGTSRLLADVWLTIYGIRMGIMLSYLTKTHRQYRNLRIVGAILSRGDVSFWTRIGRHLRQLELINCEWAVGDLHFFLQHCPVLEIILIEGCLEEGELITTFSIGSHCPNLRSYSTSYFITEANRKHLERSMPIGASMGLEQKKTDADKLEACTDDFETSADEFEASADESEASEDELEASDDEFEAGTDGPKARTDDELPLACFFRTNQTITKVDVVHPMRVNKLLIQQLELHSRTLISLRISHELCMAVSDLRHCPEEYVYRKKRRCPPEVVHPTDYSPASPSEAGSEIRGIFSPGTFELGFEDSDTFIERGESRVRALERLPNFRLNFCGEFITGIMLCLSEVSTLEHLDLTGLPLRERDIIGLAPLENLLTLRLDCDIGIEGFEVICTNFRKLEHLYLEHCETLSDDDGMKLSLLENLRELFLMRSIGFTDYTFREWFLSPGLEILSLDRSHITGFGLSDILRNHSHLETLCLSACAALSDSSLLHALQNASCLRKLRIVRCDGLMGYFLKGLPEKCGGLESLDLIGCDISLRAVQEFRERSPGTEVQWIGPGVHVEQYFGGGQSSGFSPWFQ